MAMTGAPTLDQILPALMSPDNGTRQMAEKASAKATEDRTRLRDEPDVELRVGPDRVEIRAFSQLLAISSDFFDAALGTGMLEQQTKRIELPDPPQTIQPEHPRLV